MFSLRGPPARGSLAALSKRILSPSANKSSSALASHNHRSPQTHHQPRKPTVNTIQTPRRPYSARTSADALIEDIQDQYALARDEFEISTEETEKKSVYAQADREAAREELDRLKAMYEKALQGSDGDEVQSRIGNRIRELDHAVQALEESAQEH